MSLVWSVLLFILGLFLATVVFSFVVLPLVYGLPKTIYYYLRGVLRPSAMLVYLFPPVLWSVLFVAVGLVLVVFAPSVSSFLIYNGAFSLGQFVGLGFMLARCFTPSGRADLRADFDEKILARFQI